MPEPDVATTVKNAADFAGTYRGDKGSLEVFAEGERLVAVLGTDRVLARASRRSQPVRGAPPEIRPLRVCIRAQGPGRPAGSPVVEVSWGGDWYRNDHYDGPVTFDYPKAWDGYAGHYRNESPWIGSLRIYVLKGRLTLDGVAPLEADGDLFRLRDNPYNTEWIRFGQLVNGRCMRIRLSGSDLWRVAAA